MELQKNKQRLFPIFVRGRKIVHLIRHGQSTYNEAISGPGSWDEPNIFDAPLTKLGVKPGKEAGAVFGETSEGDGVGDVSADSGDGDLRARL